MPASSADGRYGGRDLSTPVATPDREALGEDVPRRRFGVRDAAYWLFFIYYSGGALIVLAFGIGAVIVSGNGELHDELHIRAGAETTLIERMWVRMADESHYVASAAQIAFDYAFSFLNLGLAMLLLWLRPRDWTARLLAIAMVGAAGAFNLTGQSAVEIIPLTTPESFLQTSSHVIAGIAYVYALLLFPDGRPVPRWPTPAIAALYAPVTAGAVFLALRVEGTARPAALLVFHGLVATVAGILAQAYRFRRAPTPSEHAQARLMVLALLPALGVGVYFVLTQGFDTITVTSLEGRHLPEQPVEVFRIFQPVFLLVPFALFLGLIRFRLWDIDRVVNRTVVYGLATGILLGAYFGIVVLLQRLFSPFFDRNELAVAISTLAVAAAFIPVRRRIQDFVDRRFYRHRYDAQQTIEAFSSRLRDQLDLESLAFELREAVVRTMQPAQLSLLVKGNDGRMEWQWTYRGRGGRD
jgi:hypothetical protein